LARAGRAPKELAAEFEPSEQTIRNWIFQAEADRGERPGALTTEEREELSRLRRENRQLKIERDILGKAAAWFARDGDDSARLFTFVSANQATFPIATVCRVLGVSESGFYAWLQRAPSARRQRDAELLVAIRASHARSDGTYGAPRVREDLREVGCKRIARLLLQDGLCGVSKRRGPVRAVRAVP
jgi:transposase-like protein